MYQFFILTLGLFVISLSVSNAGMEVSSALLNVGFLGYILWYKLKKAENPHTYQSVGPDYFLWGFWAVGIVGALTLTKLGFDSKIEVIGEFRWIWFLYTLFALLTWAEEKGHFHKLLKVFIYVGVLTSTFALLQVYFGWDPFRSNSMMHQIPRTDLWRAKGFFSSTMTFSYSFGMLFCFLAAYQLVHNKKDKLLWVGTAIMGATLVLTFTRGLWLSLAVAVLLMTFRYSKKTFAYVLASLFITASLSYQFIPQFQKRADTIFSMKKRSNYQRVDLWKSNWEMFKDNPVLGVGFGRTSQEVEPYNQRRLGERGFVSHSHNNFLEVLAGSGALGFLAYLAIFGFFFWQAWAGWTQAGASELTRALALGSLGMQTVFHLGGMTQSVLIDNECFHMFSFLHIAYLVQFSKDQGGKVVPT